MDLTSTAADIFVVFDFDAKVEEEEELPLVLDETLAPDFFAFTKLLYWLLLTLMLLLLLMVLLLLLLTPLTLLMTAEEELDEDVEEYSD